MSFEPYKAVSRSNVMLRLDYIAGAWTTSFCCYQRYYLSKDHCGEEEKTREKSLHNYVVSARNKYGDNVTVLSGSLSWRKDACLCYKRGYGNQTRVIILLTRASRDWTVHVCECEFQKFETRRSSTLLLIKTYVICAWDNAPAAPPDQTSLLVTCEHVLLPYTHPLCTTTQLVFCQLL